MKKSFHNLLNQLGVEIPPSLNNPDIYNLTFDSRDVKQGDLFIGLPGAKVDGGIFCLHAIRKGAVASIIGSSAAKLITPMAENILVVDEIEELAGALASIFWGNPSSKMSLIGITGTNGKTTIAHLVEHLSTSTGIPSALFGTLGNRWPGHSERSSFTTCFADKLQNKLSEAIKAGVELGVMEVSSHSLAQKRVYGCHFSGAIFTNLTQDHLDYHLTMESYFKVKSSLFSSPFIAKSSRNIVVNVDDFWGKRLAKTLEGRCWRSSILLEDSNPEGYELTIQVINKSPLGIKALINTPRGRGSFISPLLGNFNLMNILQAIGILLQHGYSLNDLLDVINDFPGVPGRMEVIKPIKTLESIQYPLVIVDYAHTPDGLEKALISIKDFAESNIICVFGCGGDRDRDKRSKMGSIASKYADCIILTSDNPRTEDSSQIFADIMFGIPSNINASLEPDRSLAISKAISQAKTEDIILIAGKGHEDYQIIGDRKIYFDDRIQAKRELLKRIELDKK